MGTSLKIASVMMIIVAAITALSVGRSMRQTDTWPRAAKPNAEEWGKVSEGFQLSAQLKEGQVHANEPILLKLTIRNVSYSRLYIEEIGPEKEYKLEVKNERGDCVALTEAGKQLQNTDDISVVGLPLEPNQERQDIINVSRLLDTKASGTYFITASRKVRKQNGNGWSTVVSNTVKVTVVD